MKKITRYVLFLAVFGLLFIASCKSSPSLKYDDFAKCLTEKGVKFYGAFWCPHCENEKAFFGDSIKYVNYIECSTSDGKGQLAVCADAKVSGYPTFEFSDKSRLEGEQSLATLSQKSGCALPN